MASKISAIFSILLLFLPFALSLGNANPPVFSSINLAQFPFYIVLDDPEVNLGNTYRLYWSIDPPSTRDRYLPVLYRNANAAPPTTLTRPKGSKFKTEEIKRLNASTVLHMCLVLDIARARQFSGQQIEQGSYSSNVWMGIGFGGTMLDAEFVVANVFNTSGPEGKTVYVDELHSTDSYRAPIQVHSPATPGAFGVLPGVATVERNFLISEFRFLTTETPVESKILWAFQAGYAKTQGRTWGYYHGNSRGLQLIQFVNGTATPSLTVSVFLNRVHAAGMGAVVLLFIIGTCYARFLRHRSEWLIVHIVTQSVAVLMLIGFFIVMFINLPKHPEKPLGIDDDSTHAVFGTFMSFFMGLQVVFGILTVISLRSTEKLFRIYKYMRISHKVVGRLFLIFCLIQSFSGIQIMFPFIADPLRGREFWGLFVTLWVLILIAAVGMEFVYQVRYVNEDSRFSRVLSGIWNGLNNIEFVRRVSKRKSFTTNNNETTDLPNYTDKYANEQGNKSPQSLIIKSPSLVAERNKNSLVQRAESVDSPLMKMTWEELDEKIREGDLYVVANRKYVYSIKQWIKSHPGGHLILYSVAGTDITNDYFMESGFDSSDIQKAAMEVVENPRLRRRFKAGVNQGRTQQQTRDYSAITIAKRATKGAQHRQQTDAKISGLLESEIKHLIRARRTHVHTQLAIEKLSTLLVGEIVPKQRNPGSPPMTKQIKQDDFEPTEYRRYALVGNDIDTLASTTTNSPDGKSNGPVHRLKFCLLYPTTDANRLNEPEEFLPGQCVEIQMKIGTNWVSRYFTPLKGSMTSFEILLKVVVNGAMSPSLAKQKPGNRQFKIRGPFGLPVVNLNTQLEPTSPLVKQPHENYVFITSGSGLTPALHLINYLLLPTKIPLTVHTPYIAQNADELSVAVGDTVIVEQHFFDGWAIAQNLNTKLKGVIPLAVTNPRCGDKTPHITVVHGIRYACDAFGLKSLRGAALGYPGSVKIIHTLSKPDVCIADPKLNGDVNGIVNVLRRTCADLSEGEDLEGDLGKGTHKVFTGRINRNVIKEALKGWKNGSGKIVICGVKEFEGMVYENLVEADDDDDALVDHDDIVVLPEDHYFVA